MKLARQEAKAPHGLLCHAVSSIACNDPVGCIMYWKYSAISWLWVQAMLNLSMWRQLGELKKKVRGPSENRYSSANYMSGKLVVFLAYHKYTGGLALLQHIRFIVSPS